MHGTNASSDRPGTCGRLASILRSPLVAAALSLSAFAASAGAQVAAPPPVVAEAPPLVAVEPPVVAAAPPVVAAATDVAKEAPSMPALDAIVATLRERFHVAYRDALRIARAVLAESSRHALSPVLLLAVIAVESGFDRHAVSDAGARGLMQVLPAAHRDLVAHVKDLSDPATNVRIGAAILRSYLDDADGDVDTALARYSGGTKRYAQRVALHVQQFDAQFRRTASPESDDTDADDDAK